MAEPAFEMNCGSTRFLFKFKAKSYVSVIFFEKSKTLRNQVPNYFICTDILDMWGLEKILQILLIFITMIYGVSKKISECPA